MKLAYIMSRFPKLTETFVAFEILGQQQAGSEVLIYPLLREHQPITHPEVLGLVAQARFTPFFSWQILRANLGFATRNPRRYFGALVDAVRRTAGNRNFLVGALAFFPKAMLFAREMQVAGVEHIHAHFANHPALAAFLIHRVTGIPYSFTAHGTDLHRDQRMLREKIQEAEFAVTVSEYNRRFMAERCGSGVLDKIEVVRCGVDTEYFSPRGESRRPGPFRLICVASFEEVKGHRYLIDACAQLSDVEVHFVGDGPLRSEVEQQIAALELKNVITMHGPVPRDSVRALLRDADVAVLPSVPTKSGQREGVPVALMEAMACGLPVVSSNMAGIPELVDDGISGILLPPADSDALAKAINALSCDPGLVERLGAAARAKVVREFNVKTNALRLAALFRRSRQRDPARGIATDASLLSTG